MENSILKVLKVFESPKGWGIVIYSKTEKDQKDDNLIETKGDTQILMLYLLFHVSDRMVSLHLCGRGRRAVRNGRSQTLLPLNQEPSSFYCTQRKLLTLSLTRKKKRKKKVLVIFFWIPIFQRVFLPCFCIFNYASASLMFGFVLFNFLYRDNAKKKKKKTWLAVCRHLCALQRLYWTEDTAETDCG